MTSILDAVPVAVTGAVGTTESLYDLLRQAYGDNVSQIQSVYINVNSIYGSYWDPANSKATHVLDANGHDISSAGQNISAADFRNVHIVIGNNINSNVYVTVPESSGNDAFVGRSLSVTALPQQLDAHIPANHVPTAADIVTTATMFAHAENGVVNANDCHGIASAIAASAGAALDPNTGNTGLAGQGPNEQGGFWRIAYTNGAAGANWESKVQAGDIVRMEHTNQDGSISPHTVTVISGLNADGNHPGQIEVVDNWNQVISQHWAVYDNTTMTNSVTIYRLATDGLYLTDQSSETSNEHILGTTFNDLIKAGHGNDVLTGGVGNDTLDGGAGDNTAVFSGHQSDYRIAVNGGTATITDLRAGSPDGTDTITNIQHVKFADATVNYTDLKTTAAPLPAPVAGSVSIGDATITEGNNGSHVETFTVTRSGGSAAFDVHFATANGSATTADGDYVAKSGTVHFDAGVNTQTVSVVVNGDTRVEANETFNINLSGATNGATIAHGQGVVTIANDDVAAPPPPVAGSVSIGDATITEGNNGSQIETFTVTRSGGSAAFDVHFATANGTATTADGDYVAKSGTVHFDAGVNTQTVSVVVNGDTRVEANETYNVNLSGATNGATISHASGIGTIVNDDVAAPPPPVAGSVSIGDATITEGNNGSRLETFTLTRSGGSAAFDVHYATHAGTASAADGDYVAKSGTVHFDAGVNTQTVSVVVNGDTRVEANETYNVNLSGATNGATISHASGIGTIVNDDVAAPVAGSVSIGDATITEGNNGSHVETFTVTRTGGSAAFDVHYATQAGTASAADGDYVAKSGMVHFDAGVTTQTVSVVVNGDTRVEANETYNVNLSGATNGATISHASGIGTIVNDDVAATTTTHHVANDFNGDGISDVLFGTNTGRLAVWELNGNHIDANATVNALPAGWHIDGTGDFNGDGKTDILMHNDSGKVAMWQMDGNHVASNTTVGSIGSDWHVAGIGDFNGDGKADVLWENSKGQVAEWQMNGDHVTSNTTVGSIGTDWHVAGVGDFNGDGKADVLWENAKGQVAMWQMNGDHVASNTTVGSIGSDWHVAGIGDFNGDGKADVLWENAKGQVAEWQMNGDHVASNTTVQSAPGWTVIGTGDYNHDGRSDVLLQNADGRVAEWQMNGDHVTENLSVGSHSTDWHMI